MVYQRLSKEHVKKETIRIFQAIFPGGKQELPVHRLGKIRENDNRPRGIMLQLSCRTYRLGVWKAAKNLFEGAPSSLHTGSLPFWPVIEAAREEGKIAYYIGARAYVNSKEAGLPVS
ncbi:hypothetical protein ILYODFUR_035322 [Ilyodon furcidens]|uniref:Uncharacterized protein n=1 Tax=Ilyodon furcidens TaxID=33524 RepID=A0ABV0UQQ1_9TELE